MPTEADKKNFLIPPLTGFLSGVLSHTRMSAPPIRESAESTVTSIAAHKGSISNSVPEVFSPHACITTITALFRK